MTEYHDDPALRRIAELTAIVNYNAILLNSLLALLLVKGLMTPEEVRVFRLRETANCDQALAKMHAEAEARESAEDPG